MNRFMKSIVISQKAFSCDVFFAFSTDRYIDGRLIQPGISGEEFVWYLHPKGYYESDNCPVDPTQKTVTHRMSRDNEVFSSTDSSSIVRYLSKELMRFSSIKSTDSYDECIRMVTNVLTNLTSHPVTDEYCECIMKRLTTVGV
jgi:hypothetical protein